LAQSVGARRLGIGEFLLQNAIKRVLQARSTLRVGGALVEAEDTQPEAIYRKFGFRLCD
jgi:ribosomal protein S18 acetylase RimI-like enzyme